MLKESDIIHENGQFWVCKRQDGGFEVYRCGITHSTRCATFGRGLPNAKQRAIAECDRRAEAIPHAH